MPPPPSEEGPLLQANRKKERKRQQLFCKVASNFVHMNTSICVIKHIILQNLFDFKHFFIIPNFDLFLNRFTKKT